MILGFVKEIRIKGKRVLTNFEEKIKKGKKIHTIRWDITNRWRNGRKIHFATGARTGNYNCFKEGICTGAQTISIDVTRCVKVEGKRISKIDIEELSQNDGFDSVADFWAYFDEFLPFEGKIVHWTERRY